MIRPGYPLEQQRKARGIRIGNAREIHFDPRVLLYVAPAVAKAAMDSGVARKPVDLKEYESKLNRMLGEIATRYDGPVVSGKDLDVY